LERLARGELLPGRELARGERRQALDEPDDARDGEEGGRGVVLAVEDVHELVREELLDVPCVPGVVLARLRLPRARAQHAHAVGDAARDHPA
ncbi:hypothetical protein DD895_13165, partial [Staphylococcus pseudintermedius]